jgi:hypothetical protein
VSGYFSIWTVYDHPTDLPLYYVARLSTITRGVIEVTENVVMSTELEKVQDTMRDLGLTRLPRMDGDDPKILETWV